MSEVPSRRLFTPRSNTGPMRLPALSTAALLLAACTVPPPRSQPAAPPVEVPRAITAAWASPVTLPPTALASWTDEAGAVRLIVATPDGLTLRDGDTGTDAGPPTGARREAPAGLAVFGDHLFVASGGGVQVLSLPGFAPVGRFGDGAVAQPGALWVAEGGPDELRVHVADPAHARVARFLVQFDDSGRLQGRPDGGFATTAAPLGLAGDPADARLLVAGAAGVRAYDAAGQADGRTLPPATGMALWTCPDGGGYWLLAGPGEVSVLDRATFAPRGRFRDATGRALGALELHAAGSPRFPAGALYAAAEDAVLAYDLRDIATTLGLDADCVQ